MPLFMPILQMQKRGLKEAKVLAPSHMASKWQSQAPNPGRAVSAGCLREHQPSSMHQKKLNSSFSFNSCSEEARSMGLRDRCELYNGSNWHLWHLPSQVLLCANPER